jgi:carbon-monoxide dehydrogenase medium subunit
LPAFEFAAPKTLPEVFRLFAQSGTVRALAGGTDIIDQLKAGRRKVDLLVDLKRVPQLLRLDFDSEGLHLGAATCCTDVHHNAEVRRHFPALAESAGLVGSVQIQNRAAVGGNVCNAAPSADTTPSLLVHDAKAIIGSTGGTRTVPLTDFFAGPGQTVLQKNEVLIGLLVPPPPANSASAYLRFIPRNEMDIAVAGVGSYLEMDPATRFVRKARIALASVAPTPVRARAAEAVLEGKPLTAELIGQAGDAAVQSAAPITDVRGSAEYRKELVKVLTRRTLAACAERIATATNGRSH